MVKRIKTAGALLASAIMATILLTTACTDYTPEFDEAAYKYNQNFRDLFGNIDPNQDWNLVRQLAEKNGGGMDTRVNVPNSNEWAMPNIYDLAVPGYPDVLGTYYTEKGYLSSAEELKSNGTPNPTGDVTEEEIQYVSKWFRTHRFPKTDEYIDWKDYFIQEISADYDRVWKQETADSASCNDGARITTAPLYIIEKDDDYIFKESDEPLDPAKQNWKPYMNGETHVQRTIKYGMELLLIKIGNKDEEWNPDDPISDGDARWEHIYNFNSGTGTNDYGTKAKADDMKDEELKERTIQFYKASGTADFSYHNSDVDKRFREYVLKHLVFDIKQNPEVNCKIHKTRKCSNHHYDGYYLGFDYEIFLKGTGDLTGETTSEDDSSDSQMKLVYKPRDGFYSNWILKISKGTDSNGNDITDYPKHIPVKQGLLVCEDMGATDYDFNDVVLKLEQVVTIEQDQSRKDQLRITAMAAGGALPSHVSIKEDNAEESVMAVETNENNEITEIHELLNGKAPKIINAAPEFGREGKVWLYPIDWTKYDDISEDDKYRNDFVSYVFDKDLIKIKVNGKDITPHHVLQAEEYEQGKGTTGTAPHMMLLPIDFQWPQEGVLISEAYKKFKDWVDNVDKTEWCNNYEEDLITRRYTIVSSGNSALSKAPKLTMVNMSNNTTIEDRDMYTLYPGQTLIVQCTSPNTSEIFCGPENEENAKAYCDYEIIGSTIKITVKKEITSNQQVTFRFYQHYDIDNKDYDARFVVYAKYPDSNEKDLRWWGSRESINLNVEDQVTLYFETTTRRSTQNPITIGYDNTIFGCTSPVLVETINLEGVTTYKYSFTVTAKAAGSGNITVTQKIQENDYNNISLGVTVKAEGGEQPGGGGVNYEDMFGESLTKDAINPADLGISSGIKNSKILIETSKFPSSGNVTITFVVTTWGNLYKYGENKEENAQTMLTEESLSGSSTNSIPGDTHVAVQWTGDVTALTDYQYIGCQTGEDVVGIYVKVNNPSSAKKRTIPRK